MSQGSVPSLFRHLILGCLLLLLPVTGLFIGFRSWSADVKKQQIRSSSEDLQQITSHLQRLCQSTYLYQDLLDRLATNMQTGKSGFPPCASETQDLIECFFFSASGKRIFPVSFASRRFITASERVFSYIRLVQNKQDPVVTKADHRLIESFLGSVTGIALLAHAQNQIIDLSLAGTNRLGSFYEIPDSGEDKIFLLALVDRKRISQMQLIADALEKQQNISGPDFQFGWVDLRDQSRFGVSGRAILPASWRSLIGDFRLSSNIQTSTRLFCTLTLDRTLRLFGTCRLPREDARVTFFRQLLFLITGSALLLFFWFWGYKAFPTIPLRHQLLFLFGCIGAAGILCLLANARQYRETREMVLIREQQTRATRILEKIDSSFLPSFQTLIARYRSILDTLYDAPGNLESACVQLREWRRDGSLLSGMIIDQEGKIIVRIPEENSLGAQSALASKGEGLINRFALRILQVFNGQEKIPEEEKGERKSIYQTLLSRQLELVVRERGNLIALNLGDDESIHFIDLPTNRSGKAEHCFFLLHQKSQMEASFLRRMTLQLSGEKAPIRFFARPKKPASGLLSFPESQSRHPELIRISEAAQQADGVVHRRVRFDGVPMVLTTLPGREVTDYFLILGTPLQGILDRSKNLTRRFLAIAFLMVVFALFLGWLFSNTLLHPIEKISSGIENLTNMRFQSSVVVNTGDELETIAKGLNQVMSEFHEMAMARTVQEHLLPAGRTRAGTVECRGWSRSSAEIGGEMYDFFECSPGRWAVLMADSTAFGISAAILMAMTKMAVRLLAEDPLVDSTKVVNSLQAFYRRHAPQLEKLFLFFGILDVSSGQFGYTASSGLTIYSQSDSGRCCFQSSGFSPLGAAFQGGLSEQCFSLPPGSRFFVASDGFSSSIGTWIDEGRSISLEEFGPWLFRRVDQSASNDKTADQTIVVLETPL